MVYEAAYDVEPQFALADAGVAVLVRAGRVLAVINMQSLKTVKSDDAVELIQNPVKIVYYVVAGVASSSSNLPPTSEPLPDMVSRRTVVVCS